MIQIWKVDKYHNADIFIQKIGYDGFQFIIHRNGKFHQAWVKYKPDWWRWFLKEPYTPNQKEKVLNWCLNAAKSTIEELEKIEKRKIKDGKVKL